MLNSAYTIQSLDSSETQSAVKSVGYLYLGTSLISRVKYDRIKASEHFLRMSRLLASYRLTAHMVSLASWDSLLDGTLLHRNMPSSVGQAE
jgi:EAL domain-containing protein (putative c-di-GMP-specific phosphodiesterase class I)